MRKILITVVLSLITVVVLVSPFFIKVKTECRTQYGECPAEIASSVNFNETRLISTKRKIKKALGTNPLVLDYRTQFKLPGVLVIDIIIKKPFYAIRGINVSEIGLVDTNGKVLSIVSETGLPIVIDSTQTIKLGESVTNQDLFALKLIQGIYEMYQVRESIIQDDSLVVELPSQIKVLLPLSGERDLILGTIRLVYAKVLSEEQKGKYSEIDLRFKNPVIR